VSAFVTFAAGVPLAAAKVDRIDDAFSTNNFASGDSTFGTTNFMGLDSTDYLRDDWNNLVAEITRFVEAVLGATSISAVGEVDDFDETVGDTVKSKAARIDDAVEYFLENQYDRTDFFLNQWNTLIDRTRNAVTTRANLPATTSYDVLIATPIAPTPGGAPNTMEQMFNTTVNAILNNQANVRAYTGDNTALANSGATHFFEDDWLALRALVEAAVRNIQQNEWTASLNQTNVQTALNAGNFWNGWRANPARTILTSAEHKANTFFELVENYLHDDILTGTTTWAQILLLKGNSNEAQLFNTGFLALIDPSELATLVTLLHELIDKIDAVADGDFDAIEFDYNDLLD
jgi:hypothetical protein